MFNHREYNYRRGFRSRPRSADEMMRLLRDARFTAAVARELRAKHRRKNLPGKGRELHAQWSLIDRVQQGIREEQGRASRDPVRKQEYGVALQAASDQLQYERRALRRIIAKVAP